MKTTAFKPINLRSQDILDDSDAAKNQSLKTLTHY